MFLKDLKTKFYKDKVKFIEYSSLMFIKEVDINKLTGIKSKFRFFKSLNQTLQKKERVLTSSKCKY